MAATISGSVHAPNGLDKEANNGVTDRVSVPNGAPNGATADGAPSTELAHARTRVEIVAAHCAFANKPPLLELIVRYAAGTTTTISDILCILSFCGASDCMAAVHDIIRDKWVEIAPKRAEWACDLVRDCVMAAIFNSHTRVLVELRTKWMPCLLVAHAAMLGRVRSRVGFAASERPTLELVDELAAHWAATGKEQHLHLLGALDRLVPIVPAHADNEVKIDADTRVAIDRVWGRVTDGTSIMVLAAQRNMVGVMAAVWRLYGAGSDCAGSDCDGDGDGGSLKNPFSNAATLSETLSLAAHRGHLEAIVWLRESGLASGEALAVLQSPASLCGVGGQWRSLARDPSIDAARMNRAAVVREFRLHWGAHLNDHVIGEGSVDSILVSCDLDMLNELLHHVRSKARAPQVQFDTVCHQIRRGDVSALQLLRTEWKWRRTLNHDSRAARDAIRKVVRAGQLALLREIEHHVDTLKIAVDGALCAAAICGGHIEVLDDLRARWGATRGHLSGVWPTVRAPVLANGAIARELVRDWGILGARWIAPADRERIRCVAQKPV